MAPLRLKNIYRIFKEYTWLFDITTKSNKHNSYLTRVIAQNKIIRDLASGDQHKSNMAAKKDWFKGTRQAWELKLHQCYCCSFIKLICPYCQRNLKKKHLKKIIAIFLNIEKFHEYLSIFDKPPPIKYLKISLSKIPSDNTGQMSLSNFVEKMKLLSYVVFLVLALGAIENCPKSIFWENKRYGQAWVLRNFLIFDAWCSCLACCKYLSAHNQENVKKKMCLQIWPLKRHSQC